MIAPTTTLSSNPAPNGGGYVTSAPTLTLTATDPTTGVASITYKIGAASPVTVTAATTSFLVPGAGNTTITYYATDNAGNMEADAQLHRQARRHRPDHGAVQQPSA